MNKTVKSDVNMTLVEEKGHDDDDENEGQDVNQPTTSQPLTAPWAEPRCPSGRRHRDDSGISDPHPRTGGASIDHGQGVGWVRLIGWLDQDVHASRQAKDEPGMVTVQNQVPTRQEDLTRARHGNQCHRAFVLPCFNARERLH